MKRRAEAVTPSCVEHAWEILKECLLTEVDNVCDKGKNGGVRQVRLRCGIMQLTVSLKRNHNWKRWKQGESKEDYKKPKRL